MARDINLGPTGGPYVNLQENSGDLDITGATDVDLNGANLTNGGLTEGFENIQVFEADGTFDASSVEKAFVECVGGGGGGGGTVDNGTDTVQIGSGGGGGEYAASIVDLSAESSVTVTVGSGGAEATNGSDTQFASFITANGGNGGVTADDNDILSGGSGGTGSTVDVTVDGGVGGDGLALSDTGWATNFIVQSAAGGDSAISQAPRTKPVDNNLVSFIDGADGSGYGVGGSGATNATGNNSAPLSGGNGADGVVIVYY